MPAARRSSERGVTLIELLIAVTLVGLLSAGMLIAMRVSVLTYEKTGQRLESDRRAMNAARILESQIGGVMPVMGDCSSIQGPPTPIPFFFGTEDTLRLVTSFSIAEGARGYPRILEYQVMPSPAGGVRLIVNEHEYFGPLSTASFCRDRVFLPVQATPASFVLADRLQYCRFSYHAVYDENVFAESPWLPVWNQPALPSGIRVDMAPLTPGTATLPLAGVIIPIHVNRDFATPYAD